MHVFQADFATSAVDFLHRIGRTARAGQIGLVTSMYTESNRELVQAVRQAEELGQPVVNFKILILEKSIHIEIFEKMYKKYIYISKINFLRVLLLMLVMFDKIINYGLKLNKFTHN